MRSVAPRPIDQRRSDNMRAIKGKDTVPELTLRKRLHKAGFRYRLHVKNLPGVPDLVFPKSRKIIFVHGCFWHQHRCKRGRRVPKSNVGYWRAKLARNIARDRRVVAALRRKGWRVKIVWECELKRDQALLGKLAAFLK